MSNDQVSRAGCSGSRLQKLAQLMKSVATIQSERTQELQALFPDFRKALLESSQETRKLTTQEYVVQGMAGSILRVLTRIAALAEMQHEKSWAGGEGRTLSEAQLKSIPEVLDTLFHLSEQTRMLVLNVSIQATRGDAGGVPAVVAEEVADLADVSEQGIQNLIPMIEELKQQHQSLLEEITHIFQPQKTSGNSKILSGNLAKLRTDIGLIRNGITQTVRALHLDSSQGDAFTRGMLEILSELRKETSGSGLQELISEREDVLSSSEKNNENPKKWREFEAALGSRRKQMSRIGRAGHDFHTVMREVLRASDQARNNLTKMQSFSASSLAEFGTLEKSAGEMILKTQSLLKQTHHVMLITHNAEQILADIDNATVQTRMLSVSVAMEATRAGEAGTSGAKGRAFAKISTDIRELAENAILQIAKVREKLHQVEEQFEEMRLEMLQLHDLVFEQKKIAVQGKDSLQILSEDLEQTLEGTICYYEQVLLMEEILPQLNQALKAQEVSLAECERTVILEFPPEENPQTLTEER